MFYWYIVIVLRIIILKRIVIDCNLNYKLNNCVIFKVNIVCFMVICWVIFVIEGKIGCYNLNF